MQAGVPDALLGYSVVSDNNVQSLGTAAGTAVLFGDFSGYYLRDCGVRYDISTDYAFASDMTPCASSNDSTARGSTSTACAA